MQKFPDSMDLQMKHVSAACFVVRSFAVTRFGLFAGVVYSTVNTNPYSDI